MTNQLTHPSASESRSLCTSITSKGRRCRYPVHIPGSQLCKLHSRPRRINPSEPEANPLAGLSPEISAFHSYADISQFLARLLTLLAENRISPRRAAVLSYVANSLLNSLRAAERLSQYEAAHEPEEEFHMDFSHMSAPHADSSRPSSAPSTGSSDSSPILDAHTEVPSPDDPVTTPVPQHAPSVSRRGGDRSEPSHASVQHPPAPPLGHPLPQTPIAPCKPYDDWSDPKCLSNRRT